MGRGIHKTRMEPKVQLNAKITKEIYIILCESRIGDTSCNKYLNELILQDLRKSKLI